MCLYVDNISIWSDWEVGLQERDFFLSMEMGCRSLFYSLRQYGMQNSAFSATTAYVRLHRENTVVKANKNLCYFKWVFLLKNLQ